MDGAKTLEVRHLWTRRRSGSGTITQSIVEQERSVSALAERLRGAALGAPVVAKPISGNPVKWNERRAEVGGGHRSDDRGWTT